MPNSIIEAFSSAVIDKFHFSRKSVVSVVCITGFLGSIIFTANSGLFWLDIVDHFITHYGLIAIGIFQCILVGWIFKAHRLRSHINSAGDANLTKGWDICIKVITPLILIVLLINDFRGEISQAYEGYSWLAVILIGWDWLIITLIAALFIAGRDWKKELKIVEKKN